LKIIEFNFKLTEKVKISVKFRYIKIIPLNKWV